MIDRYTKVLLTVIAVNMTIMVGWGAVKVLVPEVSAYGDIQNVRVVDFDNDLTRLGDLKVHVTSGEIAVWTPHAIRTCNEC